MTIQKTSLHPILLENPNKIYDSYLFRSKIYKIASLVSILAICVFSIYLASFFGSTAASIGIYQLISALTVPFFGVLYSNFYLKHQSFLKKALFYQKIVNEIQELNQQTLEEINKLLYKFNCSATDIQLSLNAIAHFKVWIALEKKSSEEIQTILQTKTDDSNLKHKLQKIAHGILENEVLKAKLKAAEVFYVISNPYGKKRISDIGKAFPLSFSRRMTSFFSGSDSYFVFYDHIITERKKTGLSTTEIKQKSISDISKIIFNY